MTADEAVLDRVRKLLALATSPNVHEAAVAAARAQRLIAEHRLEALLAADAAQEQGEPIDDARDAPLEVARKLRAWKIALASALARCNGCVAYTLDQGGSSAIVLVGRASDRAAVRALWDWLVRRIEWLSATAGPQRSRAWHEAFRVGAVDTVAERLTAAGEQAQRASAGLMRVDQALAAHQRALDAFVNERLKLGAGRGLRVRFDGYQAGKRAAFELDLPDE